jgi:hypothetical protein
VTIDSDGFGTTIQKQARFLIEPEPMPLTDREREDRPCGLTDELDNLLGSEDEDELVIIGAGLLPSRQNCCCSNEVDGVAEASGY